MSTNENGIDRVVRIIIAIAAALGAWTVGFGSVLGIVLLIVAAIRVLTAVTGFCPLYRIFGMSTAKDRV